MEEERIIGAITELRALGDGMCDANSEWAAQWADYWHRRGPRTDCARVAAPTAHQEARKPGQKLLGTQTVTRCLDLTAETPQLDVVLVEVAEDGQVRAGAALTEATAAPTR